MLKGEIEILAAIMLNKRTVRQVITGRLARYSPSIISTLETLSQKRYIIKHKTKGYLITEKGIIALAEFYPEHALLNKTIHAKLLRKQVSEANQAVKMIEQLSIEYDIKINGLQNLLGDKTSN
jgi:Mn-dependent DtxR family transcriptional regulator